MKLKFARNFVLGIGAVLIFTADARAGRWLSRDPFQEGEGFVERDPRYLPEIGQAQRGEPNMYAFVLNEPVSSVDPMGLHIYIMAPEVGALDSTDFGEEVRQGFQKIIGDCTMLYTAPIVRQVETGGLFSKKTSPKLIGWEIYYKDEKPNCICSSCWKTLKAALGDNLPPRDVFIYRPTTRFIGGVDFFDNAVTSPNGQVVIYEGVKAKLPETSPSGSVTWGPAPFEVVLWHEAIGHGYLELGHPDTPSNHAGGSGKDPTIVEENNARKCLRLQGVIINNRVPTYWGWKNPQANP